MNESHNINRLVKGSHTISIDAGQVFDTIQHPFLNENF